MSWLPHLRTTSFRRYSSCAAPIRSQLERPPIAYHYLRTPIPYDIGLQLQENIVDTRARWRKAGTYTGAADDVGDVVLLLGELYPSIRYFITSSSLRAHADLYHWTSRSRLDLIIRSSRASEDGALWRRVPSE